jgi:23S rRNA (uracil1939-C5)-methyltransferase
VLVGAADLDRGHRAWIHDVVVGRRWRISARSFFQSRPDGAEGLVDAVVAGIAPTEPRRVADLYAGVGLFAGALHDRLATAPARTEVVEANRGAVADARVNLADLQGVRVVAVDVRRWRPSAVDAVVADPSRHGLGADAVRRIAATGAVTLALVSCDPAALGRDAGLLAAAGYDLRALRMIDLFPHTPHVEVVSLWRHPAGAPAP